MGPKAITVVSEALARFEGQEGLTPRVALLPRRIFRQYESEVRRLEAVMPGATNTEWNEPTRREPGWTDVRLVEHEGIEEIEVY